MKWKLKCDVCEDDFEDIDPNLQSCNSYQYILNIYKKSKRYNYVSVRHALKEAFSCKEHGKLYFECEYTGIISTFDKGDGTIGHFKN
jgi:hypothetical protein